MSVSAPRLPGVLLFAALLWLSGAVPAPPQCDPRELPDQVIDIGVAVAKGARFTDPINAASGQECVSACCSELRSTGEPACNFAVYDTRKSKTLQNCYLFLCPGPEACPLSPARGVLSYSLWTENSSTENDDGNPTEEHSSKTPKSKDDSKPVSSSGKKQSSSIHAVEAEAPELEEKNGQPELAKKKPSSSIDPGLTKEEEFHLDLDKKNPSSSIDLGKPEAPLSEEESSQKDQSKKKPSSPIDPGVPKTSVSEGEDLSKKKPSSSLHPVVLEAPVSEIKFDQQDSVKSKPSQDVDSETETGEVREDSEKGAPDTPGHITSELLHLAENIDKRLEKIEAESGEGRSSDKSLVVLSIGPAEGEMVGAPVKSTQDKEPKKAPPKKEDTKVIEKKTETLEVHYPTPKPTTMTTTTTTTTTTTSTTTTTTTAFRTSHKVTTAAPQPAQRTKLSLITSSSAMKAADKMPSSDTKSVKVPSAHPGETSATTVKSVPDAHPTTTEVPTKNPQPETPDNPSRTSKSTLRDEAPSFSSQDVKRLGSGNLNDSKNLDSQGPFLGFSDRSGLVAALVFGVVFLVVIISLVSRKMSEARRRHQYTKLDYLINGMYVDT